MLNNVNSVYTYKNKALQELLCIFYNDIEECKKATLETNEFVSWLKEIGISEEVTKEVNELFENGTFNEFIENNLVAWKDDVNTQLDTMTNSTNKENATLGEELLNSGGWTSNGWIGDFNSGFTHTVGQTTALTKDIGALVDKVYHLEFTVDSPTSDYDVDVSIGNSVPFELYTGVGTKLTYKISIKALDNGVLSFTPKSSFDGKISNISVKEVIGSYDATYSIKDNKGVNAYEVRNNLEEQKNVFVGKNVGKYNYSGYDNVGVGYCSLENNVDGFWNVGLGTMALNKNIGGSRNVAIGYNALTSNISGQRNQAIGSWALKSNTTGIRNIAIGSDCMFQNVSGSQNISIGMASMYYNTTGIRNVAIGDSALNKNSTGELNVGVGYFAGSQTTTGNYNVSIGGLSLSKNVTGSNNIAIGHQALFQSTTDSNIAIGKDSQYNLTSGGGNISLGFGALKRNVTGSNNIAIGYQACQSTTGQNVNNIISIGHQSGYNISEGATNNIFLGYRAGYSVTTGIANVLIGYNIQTPTPTTNNYFSICDVITGNVSTKAIILPTIPTSDPKNAGQVWSDNGTLKISQG